MDSIASPTGRRAALRLMGQTTALLAAAGTPRLVLLPSMVAFLVEPHRTGFAHAKAD